MTRLWLAVAAAAGLLLACGSNPVPGLAAASPQSVSLQKGDVPSGLQACANETGDINKVGAQDQSTQAEWKKQQAAGAKSGYVTVFTNDTSTCKSLSNSSGPASAKEQLLGSIVVQYRDATSAAQAYKSGVFGFNPADPTQMRGATSGTATGLGANSAFESQAFQGTSFTVGIWQNKAFVAFVVGFGVPADAAKKAAGNMNGRIH
jgi:hypothetical protein